jgi:ABC-type Fe3+/spermidine/putrescine transport system ATPase subunit
MLKNPDPEMAEPLNLLTVSGISKKKDEAFILQDISFNQQKFQKIAIAGETGSGKSTLMKIIAGLINPDIGEVYFENERIKRVPEEKLIPGHIGIAYLSQYFDLPHFLRVEQALQYSNELAEEEAGLIYEVCRISQFLKRRTDQLSGGEKQRIALAKLLISSPTLLLLDEPFSNIDLIQKNILKSVIHDLGEHLNITCMMVSHDPLDTLSWADEIKIMKGGKILQSGSPRQIYYQPVNEYGAGLFGQYNLIDAALAHAFTGDKKIGWKGDKLLVRPESFHIIEIDSQAPQGTILDIQFLGSYVDTVVSIGNSKISIRSAMHHLSKGDRVSVSVAPENIWKV